MKRIITAETIRQMAHEGKKQLEVNFTECLITPEARVIAAELGVALSEIVASDLAKAPIADKTCALKDKTVGAQPSATELAQIRAAVLAQLPHGAATPELVDQLVRKMLAESRPEPAPSAADGGQNQEVHILASGIKRIKGDRVQLSQFVGVSDHQVGLADVITSADKSSMAAGFWYGSFTSRRTPKPLRMRRAARPILPVPITPTVLPCMLKPTSPSSEKLASRVR